MRFLHSIRWRLQLWYGLLLIVVLSGFGITAYRLESSRQMRQIDEELQQRLPLLVAAQRPAKGDRELREFKLSARDATFFDRVGGEGFYYVVWLKHSLTPVTYSPAGPQDVPMPKPGDLPIRSRGLQREAFLFPGPGDCVLVGRSIRADLGGLRQFAWWLTGAGIVVLLVGLAGGGWLVVRALRPIGEIGTTASKIATGDLSQRIDSIDTESELGELARVLNATFARLDAAFTQQARFTTDAAHELRTPITVMLTHLQNGLSSECANEDHREAFEASQRAAQRMRRLIESLLQLARLDAGQEPLRQRDCDLATLVQDCIELIRPLAQSRRIHIESDLASASCRVDPDLMAQVITNLLTNGIDYNQEGGQLRVETRLLKDRAVICVSNTGAGIASESLPHVFDRFFRIDSARTHSSGHSGLGLGISKAIVQAHGGEITVASVPEKETRFTITLPA